MNRQNIGKSDKELLLLIKKEDKVAFYKLYERYSRRVYGFAIKFIKQEADAEEIVQEVFIKIWEIRSNIDVNTSFESFLFTIAYNLTISLFRNRASEKKYLEHLKSLQQQRNEPDILEKIYFHELRENFHFLMKQLTPRQREIILLSRKEGLSHNEISEKLKITVNTVKKHMSNSLSFLKLHLNDTL